MFHVPFQINFRTKIQNNENACFANLIFDFTLKGGSKTTIEIPDIAPEDIDPLMDQLLAIRSELLKHYNSEDLCKKLFNLNVEKNLEN